MEEKKGFDLPKPVKEGDIVEVTIESVGAKGDGIAKKDGFVIFIPGAQKGETLKVKIVSLKRTFGIGERV
ncbi:MAG: TRAM domain-containing protein [Candidatus Micrarchaeota archaeon]